MKRIITIIMVLAVCSNSLAKINIDSKSVKLLNQGTVTEFIDNVCIKSPEFLVTSDRAVSRKQDDMVEASGNVYIKYSSDTWNVEGWCRELEMNNKEQFFILKGDVKAIYKIDGSTEDVTEVYADRMKFNYSEDQKAFFTGHVRAVREAVTVLSEKAFYSRPAGKIEFTHFPTAVSMSDDVKTEYAGDIISMFMEDKNIRISGNTHTRVIFKDELKM